MIEYKIKIRSVRIIDKNELENIIAEMFVDIVFTESETGDKELQHTWVKLPLPENSLFIPLEEIPEETLAQWAENNLCPPLSFYLDDFSFQVQQKIRNFKEVPYSLIKK